jgi:hypothetical protein
LDTLGCIHRSNPIIFRSNPRVLQAKACSQQSAAYCLRTEYNSSLLLNSRQKIVKSPRIRMQQEHCV